MNNLLFVTPPVKKFINLLYLLNNLVKYKYYSSGVVAVLWINLFKCLGIARGPEFKPLKDAIWSVLSLKGHINRLKVIEFCFFQGFWHNMFLCSGEWVLKLAYTQFSFDKIRVETGSKSTTIEDLKEQVPLKCFYFNLLLY